jgi:Ca-activated chloride channel homolog
MKRLSLSFLVVLFLSLGQAQTYVQLILDASGSMWNKLEDGTYRIVAAKDVLGNFIKGLPTGDLNVGLRVYGANFNAVDDGACEDIELVVPMEGVDKPGLQTAVDNTTAKGATPIALALEQAAADFPPEATKKLIVLVTDGEESCGGDLQAVSDKLKSQGIEIDLKIIGFALSENAQESFAGIGEFVNAADAAQLAGALEGAVEEVVVEEPAPAARQAITLTAPATAPAGQFVEVSYDGPTLDKSDYLTIVPLGAEDTDYEDFTYVNLDTKKLTLTTPFEPGEYEVRYVNDTNGGVLARAPITLEKSDITMRVVGGEIRAGGSYQVEWTGPNGESDYITLVEPSAEDGTYKDYKYTKDGSPITLTAPLTVGQYELRYQTDRAGDYGKVFARVPAEVLEAVPVFLQAPKEVPSGSEFEVEWAGPDNDSDFVTIVPVGAEEGAYTNYKYTRDGNNPVTLTAPVDAGDYEVRYVNDNEDKMLGSIPIKVVASSASVTAPSEIPAGSAFEVTWAGSSSDSDFVTIVPVGADEGAYTDYKYTRDGNPLKINAPATPGDYEVRLVNDNEDKMLASFPVKVIAINASVQAPSEVMAGTAVDVTWGGSSSDSDYVTVVKADADEGAYGDYIYTRDGNPVSIQTPFEPGSYEVRLVNDNEDIVLARSPITLTALQVTLEAPNEVAVNTEFEVSFTGPDAKTAYIAIVPAGSPDDEFGNYTNIEEASGTVTLRSAETPGNYEVRFLGSNNKALYSIPITVK